MKIIKKIFTPLYILLDKIIVTPISKLVYKFLKFSKKYTGKLEGILNNRKALIILSLLISVITFCLVDNKAINLVETESEVLTNQKVDVTYNKEKYVVEGVPDKVDIILMGRKSDLYLAKQLGTHKVYLNLSNYKAGEHKVKMKYNYSVKSVDYKLDPGEITVKISEKKSKIMSLTYDLLNKDKLDDKLNINEVKLEKNDVYVKGSASTLEKVATVKALIDVTSKKITNGKDITGEGTYELSNIPMIAYDDKGNKLKNVEIVPKTINAEIKVESFYLSLPVKVIPKGTLAVGYAISESSSSINEVKVYGDQEAMKALTYVAAEIDVNNLSESKTFNVTLTKPIGARYMSESTTTVSVKLGNEVTKEIDGISIETKNLGNDYVASTVNVEDTTSTIIAKGVQSVLDSITPESLNAYVDLSGKGPGTYSVPVEVVGDNLNATYTPKTKTIQIKIANKS